MPQIEIDGDLLVLQHQSKGDDYKSELISQLIDMVHRAKKLFGPRDLCYTIINIEFKGEIPCIRCSEHNQIIIQLTNSAATDMLKACYQMAPETVHLLAPIGNQPATNLEEGVASYFAMYYMRNYYKEKKSDNFDWGPSHPSYRCVLKVVKPRLAEDISCIRRLRENQPSFQKMSKEAVIEEFPNLTSGDVDFLLETFDRDSCR